MIVGKEIITTTFIVLSLNVSFKIRIVSKFEHFKCIGEVFSNYIKSYMPREHRPSPLHRILPIWGYFMYNQLVVFDLAIVITYNSFFVRLYLRYALSLPFPHSRYVNWFSSLSHFVLLFILSLSFPYSRDINSEAWHPNMYGIKSFCFMTEDE